MLTVSQVPLAGTNLHPQILIFFYFGLNYELSFPAALATWSDYAPGKCHLGFSFRSLKLMFIDVFASGK